MSYIVYVIDCPEHDGGISTPGANVYYGQTNGSLKRRITNHSYANKGRGCPRLLNWIRARTRQGHAIRVFPIAESLTKEQADQIERALIKAGRIDYDLLNITDGGDGTVGWIPSAETRAKIAAAAKGRIPSAETRAKMSTAHKGQKRSEETCEKIRQLALNRSPEYRSKMSLAKKGQTHTPETRAKMRMAAKKREADKRARQEKP